MNKGGDALRTLQTYFATHNLPELSDQARTDFFRLYPEHPAAATTLMQEAERVYKDGDYEAAMPLYRLLMENYQKSMRPSLILTQLLPTRTNGSVGFVML